MELKTIIVMFIAGFALATVITYYNKRFLGRLVRALLGIDATSPETAVKVSELNIKMSPALKHALRPGTAFSQIVIATSDGRYYIAPERKELAKAKYHDEGVTIVFVLIMLLILSAAALAAVYVFPEVLGYAEDRLTSIFG